MWLALQNEVMEVNFYDFFWFQSASNLINSGNNEQFPIYWYASKLVYYYSIRCAYGVVLHRTFDVMMIAIQPFGWWLSLWERIYFGRHGWTVWIKRTRHFWKMGEKIYEIIERDFLKEKWNVRNFKIEIMVNMQIKISNITVLTLRMKFSLNFQVDARPFSDILNNIRFFYFWLVENSYTYLVSKNIEAMEVFS